jgi:repressor LexA
MRPTEPPDPDGRDLTQRQRKILQAIEDAVQRDGYSPTLREIGQAAELASTSSVAYQISVLEKKGHLSRSAGRPRTAVPRRPMDAAGGRRAGPGHSDAGGRTICQVPLVGRVAAGQAILADEMIEDIIPLPSQLVGGGNLIVLKVAGDSMIGAAIADGDWVVVRLKSDIQNGDIVVAMIESESSGEPEATVKTFKKSGGHVWLIPHNSAYEPIQGDNAEILGKVVSVLRRV